MKQVATVKFPVASIVGILCECPTEHKRMRLPASGRFFFGVFGSGCTKNNTQAVHRDGPGSFHTVLCAHNFNQAVACLELADTIFASINGHLSLQNRMATRQKIDTKRQSCPRCGPQPLVVHMVQVLTVTEAVLALCLAAAA